MLTLTGNTFKTNIDEDIQLYNILKDMIESEDTEDVYGIDRITGTASITRTGTAGHF